MNIICDQNHLRSCNNLHNDNLGYVMFSPFDVQIFKSTHNTGDETTNINFLKSNKS